MSDAPPDTTNRTADTAEDWDELATLPMEKVRELFVTLGKALRAYQLYDENNPVYQRFVSALREAFSSLWPELDRLHVQVTEGALLLGPAEVYRNESRSDSLAFLLYKDGIRDVTFLPGIEEEELVRLLAVLHRARNLKVEGDDLLTILWEEELQYFRYNYVDLLAEGVVLPEPGPGNEEEELKQVLEAESPEEVAEDAGAEEAGEEAPKPLSKEDFNPTLYSLDAREMEQLRKEIDREMKRDLRADVLAALFDRLEEPEDRERQSEILGIFTQLLPNFLSRGALSPAADVLAHVEELAGREGVFDQQRMDEARDLVDTLSSPETMEELVRSLEDGSIRPSSKELSQFLSHLRSGALAPLLRGAETTDVKELQPILRQAVGGIARRNPDALAGLLRDQDPVVVAGAARLTGRLKLTEAGPALADLMGHEDARVRLACVEAARDLKVSTVAGALVGALQDPERDVRVTAVRALGELRYHPAADDLASLISSKEVRNADLTEKIAFFESYGMLGGEEAVDRLSELLNRRGFLGRREPSEIRACAALALGKIASGPARNALEQAEDDEDPVVRNAVSRALRGEE